MHVGQFIGEQFDGETYVRDALRFVDHDEGMGTDNVANSHRKERSERLTPDESDRLLRLLRAIAKAEDTFQNDEKVRRWLRKSSRALGGEAPFEMLRTASGARLVEQVLGRIAHGMYG